MRLTKEHVGKEVKLYGWDMPIRVTAVGKYNFLAINHAGEEGQWDLDRGWVVVEPKKKPSERIDELLKDRLNTYGTYDSIRFDTIKMFLDEQAEASK